MKVLVVVDMQNDFIDGALGTKEAEAIVPKVVTAIREFDGRVVATRDTHEENYLDTQEGKNLPVEHCIRGTKGWEIRDEISEWINEPVFDKVTFGSVDLGQAMAMYQEEEETIESITLVGLCTDICVISNAMLLKAYLPETKIIVDASLCAGVTPQSHKQALEAMKVCQIEIINE